MVTKAEFDAAYDNAKNLKGGSQGDQLELYGWGKIGKAKEDITTAKKPSMWDASGKYKRTKWQEMVDAGVTQQEAMDKYVEKFEALKAEHGLK